MKKILMSFALISVVFGADNATDWLPNGESIDVMEYNSNNPHSPAAFSSVDSKGLTQSQQKGQKIYSKWCLPCHGIGMPATNALAVTYKDTDIPALIEDRTDLSPEIIEVFVRYGRYSMPIFRKTEINDEEMKFLTDYLSRNLK